jgi:thiol:disulfide interchange protein DsbC
MKSHTRVFILAVVGAMAPIALMAATPAASAPPTPSAAVPAPPDKDSRADIAAKIPGAKVEDLRPSPVPGMYELMRGTDIAYVSTDGKYAIAGDLYDLNANNNLSETRRRDARVKILSGVPESQMLIFSPKDPQYTITVFTDVDCGYCRKLHSEIAEYNRLGIKVRYLFYPRTGPDTDSWHKADEVWCSPNRNEALTRAKRGEDLKVKSCASSPVAKHYELGREMDLRGTPAIITSQGDMLPGYVPPAMLAQQLRASR